MSNVPEIPDGWSIEAAAKSTADQLTKTCFRYFQDIPSSQTVDAGVFAQKLAEGFCKMSATLEEVETACRRLDRVIDFRPTASRVIREVERVREERELNRRQKALKGAVPVLDENGYEFWIQPSQLEEYLAQGYTIKTIRQRTIAEWREILKR